MNGEEVKLKLAEVHGNDAFDRGMKKANRVAKIWINKIYDDFKSRTCNNCAKYDLCSIRVIMQGKEEDVSKFGCNKWVSKK